MKLPAASLLCFAVAAAEPPHTFKIADVHPSPPASVWAVSAMREPTLGARSGQIRGGRYELHAATLVDLISAAYALDPARLIGGPEWLDTARFDVIAKLPEGAAADSIPETLRSLLAERFHLLVHPGVQPFREPVLEATPRISLKASAGGADLGCKPDRSSGEAGISCSNITMAQFAQNLPRIAGDYFQGNALIDRTHLSGAFDFTLHWTRRNRFAAAGSGGTSLGNAVDKQLGLKLALEDVDEPVIVVDHADLNPTANSPAVAEQLPPMRLAFEVAAIKPTAPGVTEKQMRIEPGGGLTVRATTLKSLIKIAWDFEDLDAIDNDELLAGAPKFSESMRYDIVAHAPASAPVDLDSMKLMLRALIAERFGLKTHVEMRTVPVLELISSKPGLRPGLQPAEPRSRSGCRNAPAALESNMETVPVFSVECRNVSMALLAYKLQAFGGPYVPHIVVDATNLHGGFDFSMRWSPPHLVDHSTPDPNGAISIVEALDKQLGLKLKAAKRPMPVMVIDRLESTPAPN
jgi:uncharacterized protein (TIGR03435 family)